MDINFAALLAFIWFAWIGSVTPGPNCMMALATAANFGPSAVLPHIIGVAIGFSSMLLVSALGIAQLLHTYAGLAQAMKWLGIGYLCWLGWQLARSASFSERRIARPPRLYESALLQYANPKAWMLMIATMGTYQDLMRPLWLQQLAIVTIFAVCCAAGLVIWTWIGASLRDWLRLGQRLAWFNRFAGGSLIATAAWSAVRA